MKGELSGREGQLGRYLFALGRGLRLGVAFADGRKTIAGRSLNQEPQETQTNPCSDPAAGAKHGYVPFGLLAVAATSTGSADLGE